MFGFNKLRKSLDRLCAEIDRMAAVFGNMSDLIEDDVNGDERCIAEADAAKPAANGTPAARSAAARRGR